MGAAIAACVLVGPRASAQSAPEASETGTPADVPTDDPYADTDPAALTDFRPTLDPHGTWADVPGYGTVWIPDPNEVGEGFQPYDTAGHWDYVDSDYTWVSDYVWGWVCFHYGRWVVSGGRWVWIPGHAYAPAWVSWRLGDGEYPYLGWSPMPPSWVWMGGVAFGLGFSPWEPWAFASYGDVLGPGLPTRVITGERATPIAPHTRPYAPAQPTVGSAAGATASAPRGPPPTMLGLDVARLPRPTRSERELRARQYARPSTAMPLGARPAAPRAPFVRYASPPTGVPHAPAAARGGGRARR